MSTSLQWALVSLSHELVPREKQTNKFSRLFLPFPTQIFSVIKKKLKKTLKKISSDFPPKSFKETKFIFFY